MTRSRLAIGALVIATAVIGGVGCSKCAQEKRDAARINHR